MSYWLSEIELQLSTQISDLLLYTFQCVTLNNQATCLCHLTTLQTVKALLLLPQENLSRFGRVSCVGQALKASVVSFYEAVK